MFLWYCYKKSKNLLPVSISTTISIRLDVAANRTHESWANSALHEKADELQKQKNTTETYQ